MMDNYFTLPKVINCLKELGVGVVGTARFKKNWPPKHLGDIDQRDANFNNFFGVLMTMVTLLPVGWTMGWCFA